jgi:hypothetical protein
MENGKWRVENDAKRSKSAQKILGMVSSINYITFVSKINEE